MATVGALAAGVAHEINNPLAAISGFAEGLQRRIGRIRERVEPEILDDFTEYTDTIIKECLRCRDIVRTLLTFSRPVASSLRPVDMNQCVRDTLFILKHHFKEQHSITVKTELQEALPIVMGDESQLKQVIINLFTNAFDATGEGDIIRIITNTGKNGGVELLVEDSGCGIPAELHDKLFEPFFTTKPVGKGTGLGLSISYQIVVDRHQGSLKCKSTLGEGTEFLIEIPLNLHDGI